MTAWHRCDGCGFRTRNRRKLRRHRHKVPIAPAAPSGDVMIMTAEDLSARLARGDI